MTMSMILITTTKVIIRLKNPLIHFSFYVLCLHLVINGLHERP